MRRIYNPPSTSRRWQISGFFLLLFLVIFFSPAVLRAQTTPEVCRETKNVMDQYDKEQVELEKILYIAKQLNFMKNLANLQEAIKGGYIALGFQNLYGEWRFSNDGKEYRELRSNRKKWMLSARFTTGIKI